MKNNNLPLTIREAFALALSPTAKNTYISIIGNGLFALFSMLATILISRVLGPTRFGTISVIFSFGIILFDVSSFGLDQALVRFVSFNLSRNKKRRAGEYTKAVFKIRVMTAFGLILSSFFLSSFLSRLFFGKPDYRLHLTVAFIGVASTILVGGFISAFLRGRQEFLKDAVLYSIRGFCRLAFLIVLFLIKQLNLTNTVLAWFFYNWLFLPLVFFFIPREFFKAKPKKIIFERLFHFAGWIYLWALTATLHSRLDIFMLERMRTSYETGIYSAATRPLAIFLTLINGFGVVLMPKIAAIKNFAQFSRFFKKIIFALLGLVLIIFLGILLARPLVLLLFGNSYAPSVRILQVLLVGIIFMALGLPFMSSLTAWGKTKIIGLISSGQLVLVAFANLVLIKEFGGIGAAITYNLSNLFAFLIALIFYWQELKLRKAEYE